MNTTTRVAEEAVTALGEVFAPTTMDQGLSRLTGLAGRLSPAQRMALCAYAAAGARIQPGATTATLSVAKALRVPGEGAWIEAQVNLTKGVSFPGSVPELLSAPPPDVVAMVTRLVREAAERGGTPRHVLAGLLGPAFQHPADRYALKALRAIPGVDLLVKKFIDTYAHQLALELRSRAVRISERSLPSLHRVLREACEVLDVKDVPDFYVEQGPINAYTLGGERHVVVITSAAASLLARGELLYVLGHELGHVKCEHVVYGQLANWVGKLGEIVGDFTLGIGRVAVATTVQPALYAWYRRSEYSADRSGLLACQDRNTAIRAMLKLAGFPARYYSELDPEAFLDQAREYQSQLDESFMDRLATLVTTWQDSHPRMVLRAREAHRWIEAGHMADLLEASQTERQRLANDITADPIRDDMLCRTAEGLGGWLAERGHGDRTAAIRAARRMLRFGDVRQGSPAASIFKVDLEVSRASANEVGYTAFALVLDGGTPAKVTIQLPSTPWEETPVSVREAFIRENQKVLAYELFKAK